MPHEIKKESELQVDPHLKAAAEPIFLGRFFLICRWDETTSVVQAGYNLSEGNVGSQVLLSQWHILLHVFPPLAATFPVVKQ